MLKKMIMINSAETEYLEIEMDSNLFFSGDNGSGKTTTIRALHYLFVTESKYVGISGDQTPFNDYYFPKLQSYLIYVFEKFFIIMYRDKSKLHKYFSKRVFDVDRLFDDEDNLLPHKEIMSYVSTPNIKQRVETNNEFRTLFYGNGEFSFNEIENYPTFIKLYSKLFNISKTIVDSDSIKEAIKDSIGKKDEFFEFDATSFYNSFYELQYLKKFYKTYERQLKSINSLKGLYTQLIQIENDQLILLQKISYRYRYEKSEFESLTKEIDIIEKKIISKKSYFKHLEKREETISKKLKKLYEKLHIELEEIKKLEIEFSDKEILKNRNIVLKKESVKEKQKQVQKSILELENQFRDIVESIDKEIVQIKQSIKDENIYLKEQVNLLKEQNNDFITKEYETNLLHKQELSEEFNKKIDLHKQNISIYEKEKDSLLIEKEKTIEEFEKKFEALSSEFEETNKKYTNEIKQLNNSINLLSKEQNDFEKEKDNIHSKYEKLKEDSQLKYKNEQELILKKQIYLKKLFDIDSNSFQAFLNDNIENWESKVYPIIEKDLLTMNIDTLKPKIVEDTHLLGIDLDISSLETLPTRQQIEMDLEEISSKLSVMKNSYEVELKKLEGDNSKEINEINRKILNVKDKIDISNLKIKELDEKREKLLEERKQKKEVLIKERESDKIRINQKNDLINEKISAEKNKIENNLRQLKLQDKSFDEKFENFKAQENKKLQATIEVLNQKTKEKIDSINLKINELENSKYNTTNEERIKQLKIELNSLNKNLDEIVKSEYFLKRYSEIKEKIDNKYLKEKELSRVKSLEDRAILLFENKFKKHKYFIEKQSEYLDKLSTINKLYKIGIEKFENREIVCIEEKESEEYLDELISQYIKVEEEYSSKRILFKDDFEIVWKNIKKYGRLELPFNLEYFINIKKVSEDENINKSIYELYNYQYKLEEEKNSSKLSLLALIEESKLRLENFDSSAKKLQSKISKIKSRLKKIDFSVINSITLERKDSTGNNAGSLLIELRNTLLNFNKKEERDLFNDDIQVSKDIDKIVESLQTIKTMLGDNKLSSYDGSSISIGYSENNKPIKWVEQLNSQASTGTNLLLKVAITISILGEYISDNKNPFYLIIDEVSQLHSNNQDKMRQFARENGFYIVFVAPEPTLIRPKDIMYYGFEKNSATLMNHI